MIIDVHTHFLPPGFVDRDPPDRAPTEYGVRIPGGAGSPPHAARGFATGFDVEQLVDVDRRAADMEHQGVDRQVLSVPPPFGFFYEEDPALASALCRSLNDEFARTVADHPDRFLGLATVPLQDPATAVRELTRAVRELGLHGVEIGTHIGPRNLDDPALAPFFAAVQELDVPLFIHSTRPLGGDRLTAYHLLNLIGNPTEDALAAASLIFGGVLEAAPRLKVYLAHGGGSCPLIRGRWRRGWEVRPEARARTSEAPDDAFRRLRFDSLTHDADALRYVVQTVGADHVLLGSDYPYDMADPDPVGSVRQLMELSATDRDAILGGNAARLFGLSS
jgi:aminocarboxymuconate-semialdehyde decarboxylase